MEYVRIFIISNQKHVGISDSNLTSTYLYHHGTADAHVGNLYQNATTFFQFFHTDFIALILKHHDSMVPNLYGVIPYNHHGFWGAIMMYPAIIQLYLYTFIQMIFLNYTIINASFDVRED